MCTWNWHFHWGKTGFYWVLRLDRRSLMVSKLDCYDRSPKECYMRKSYCEICWNVLMNNYQCYSLKTEWDEERDRVSNNGGGSHLWDNRGILIPQLLHWINSPLIHELIRTHLIKTSDVFILLLGFWWKEEAVTAKCFLPSPKSNPSEGMNVFTMRTD